MSDRSTAEAIVTNSSEYLARTAATESSIATERHFTALQAGEASQDTIASLILSLAFLPLDLPISDAKCSPAGRSR
jgi:hypothetical protein